ncbi:DUF4937 domain-containing protein [Anoxybacillus sp. PDR2]|uniref:YdbC family protein n=1 Tax=Anoxybacillaceae TaxID=3120669 RepID=UPI001315B4FB|nr:MULTISPECIES: YdbC family protein [Anoxybacillus]MBB3908408.1 heme-degrading monooxygenase HmoA [Anoxybacillus rupiensis]QHC04324.1 DUF4937 domain-containing protein [Anoxybacillus sp. PDR2]
MLLKWIKCGVFPEQKRRFSFAQEQWQELKAISGFLQQIGGWNVNDANEAYIFSFWENHSAYEAFMKRDHDEIMAKNNQRGTYHRLAVDLYMKASPNDDTFSIMEMLRKSNVLHVWERCEPLSGSCSAEEFIWFQHLHDHRRLLIVPAMPLTDSDGTTVAIEESWTTFRFMEGEET